MLLNTQITSIITKREGLIKAKKNQSFKSHISKVSKIRTIELWEDGEKIKKWFAKSLQTLYITDKVYGVLPVSPITYFTGK